MSTIERTAGATARAQTQNAGIRQLVNGIGLPAMLNAGMELTVASGAFARNLASGAGFREAAQAAAQATLFTADDVTATGTRLFERGTHDLFERYRLGSALLGLVGGTVFDFLDGSRVKGVAGAIISRRIDPNFQYGSNEGAIVDMLADRTQEFTFISAAGERLARELGAPLDQFQHAALSVAVPSTIRAIAEGCGYKVPELDPEGDVRNYRKGTYFGRRQLMANLGLRIYWASQSSLEKSRAIIFDIWNSNMQTGINRADGSLLQPLTGDISSYIELARRKTQAVIAHMGELTQMGDEGWLDWVRIQDPETFALLPCDTEMLNGEICPNYWQRVQNLLNVRYESAQARGREV